MASPSTGPAPPRTTTLCKARSTPTSLPPPMLLPRQCHCKKPFGQGSSTPTAALLPCCHVCDRPLLRRIATNPGGCGGSQYSSLIVSLASIAALTTLPGPGGIARSSPPGTSSWDRQVTTARCHCMTRPTLGATRTCTTIVATTTTATRTTEARTATVWRGAAAASGGGGWMMSEFWVILGTCTKLVTVCDLFLGGGRFN